MGRPDKKVKVVMPERHTIETLDGVVSGIAGQIMIKYRPQNTIAWKTKPWEKVDTDTDYTCQFTLQDLAENTKYEIVVLGKTNNKGVKTMEGSFINAPPKELSSPIHFMVTTCYKYAHQDIPENGSFKIYNEMKKLEPHFLVHTDEVLYNDRISKTLDLARWNWQEMNSLPSNVAFYQHIPFYFMIDDHDTWMNDCHLASKNKFMGEFTIARGASLFNHQVLHSEKSYRTFRWGKEQMDWFPQTYKASDATYKILISPTPIMGPDRPQKGIIIPTQILNMRVI